MREKLGEREIMNGIYVHYTMMSRLRHKLDSWYSLEFHSAIVGEKFCKTHRRVSPILDDVVNVVRRREQKKCSPFVKRDRQAVVGVHPAKGVSFLPGKSVQSSLNQLKSYLLKSRSASSRSI